MALPLPTPTFYRKADVLVASASIDSFLDAIFTSLSSSVDYRGTAIPSTHTWTWARYQSSSVTQAVYNTAVPTGTPMTQNPCIMIAGVAATGSLTPIMLTPDTFANNIPMIAMIKNPGAYLGWDNANPMTSGQFSGYSHLAGTGVNAFNARVRTFVSEDSIFFQFAVNNNTQFWAHAGAIIEPFTTYQNSSFNVMPACETDDRLYGISVVGSTAALNAAFQSTAQTIYNHTNTLANNHFFIFQPNSFNILATLRRRIPTTSQYQTFEERDMAGNYVFHSYQFIRTSFYTVGQSRGVYPFASNFANRTTIKDGNTDLYHILSYDLVGLSQSIVLKAAA
jgi:hypothetical protein